MSTRSTRTANEGEALPAAAPERRGHVSGTFPVDPHARWDITELVLDGDDLAPPTARSAWETPLRAERSAWALVIGLLTASSIWVGLALVAAAFMVPMPMVWHLGFLLGGAYLVTIGAMNILSSREPTGDDAE